MIITNNILWLTIVSFVTVPIRASETNQKPLVPPNPSKMEGYDPDTTPSSSGGSRWTPVLDPTNNNTIIGHHYSGLNYNVDDPCALQTLEIWHPATPASIAHGKPSLNETYGAGREAPWLVYIHGGAWRDPAIDSSSFTPSATKILSSLFQRSSSPIKKLAGIASINYRLSPYPNHPTSPSDPTDDSRTAQHPDHIADVLTAIAHLEKYYGMKSYVLAGHSCGATLALQACMDPARWEKDDDNKQGWGPKMFVKGGLGDGYGGVQEVAKPRTVVGFNGLYDLAGFIESPPQGYERWREAYREFVTSAFGSDEKVWRTACPASAGPSWVKEWKLTQRGEEGKKRKAVLVQSLEDSLVPVEQTEGMARYLEKENEQVNGDNKVEVAVLREEKGGDHDEVWQRGDRLGEILVSVLEGDI